MPALDQAEEQAIHVSIRPEEFIKDESGDIEGTISDSVYLGLNTEYFIETGFASKIQVSEESTFEEDLQKGDRIRLRINTKKLKRLFCGWFPKPDKRSQPWNVKN